MAGWPKTLRVHIRGVCDVLFCHATPRNEDEIFTRLTPEVALRPVFDGAGVPLVICGHTHMQFDILQPPTEEQMLDVFSRAEIGR